MMPALASASGAWPWLAAGLALLAGMVAGLAYFGAIWWQARWLVGGARGRPWMVTVSLLRMAVLAAGLWLAGRAGAAPLLAAALGLWLGRLWVFRRLRGEHA